MCLFVEIIVHQEQKSSRVMFEQGQGSVYNVPVNAADSFGAPAEQTVFSSGGSAVGGGGANAYPNYGVEFKYHKYDDMTNFLRTTSSTFPNLTALYSIGRSVQGKCKFSVSF
jgi:hypothetical protein